MNTKWKPDIEQIMRGVEHETLEDAIAADLVSGIPFVGAVTDFLRLIDSGTKPRRVLQSVDLLSSPLPFSDVFTPTNTIAYLDKNGILPFKLDELNTLTEKLLPMKVLKNGIRKHK